MYEPIYKGFGRGSPYQNDRTSHTILYWYEPIYKGFDISSYDLYYSISHTILYCVEPIYKGFYFSSFILVSKNFIKSSRTPVSFISEQRLYTSCSNSFVISLDSKFLQKSRISDKSIF